MQIKNNKFIKKQMCAIGQRIWQKGFCAGNEGNHSVKVSEDRFWVTPSGISKGFLDPRMICLIDKQGKQLKGRPFKRTSEALLHLAVYARRSDIGAIVHSHPPAATTFAVAGMPLPNGIHPEFELFLGQVPLVPYGPPSTEDLAHRTVAAIGPATNALLMANHGVLCWGADLEEAYYRLEIIESYCRLLLNLKQLAKPQVLSVDAFTELLQVKSKFGFSDDRLEKDADLYIQNKPYLDSF
jgi:L-fuculose-phosphate aldolase